jgi:hypothetical protein
VIDPRFVYLAAALSVYGVYGYVRDTLRGETTPHRVSWGLWGVVGVLAFVDEVQQHVGLAAVMTLFYGLAPIMVFVASFFNPQGVWKASPFDYGCAALSIVGIVAWALVHQATLGLVAFITADQVAALPTLRKAWTSPESESSRVFSVGVVNSAITLLTLDHLTTGGVLFPGTILVCDAVIALVVMTRVGPRLHRRRTAVRLA